MHERIAIENKINIYYLQHHTEISTKKLLLRMALEMSRTGTGTMALW